MAGKDSVVDHQLRKLEASKKRSGSTPLSAAFLLIQRENMCGLCQLHLPFGAIPLNSAIDRLKTRAIEIKQAIKVYEVVAQFREEINEPPCEVSAERLRSLKDEQFKLAQKL